jgi:hypothetical protein
MAVCHPQDAHSGAWRLDSHGAARPWQTGAPGAPGALCRRRAQLACAMHHAGTEQELVSLPPADTRHSNAMTYSDPSEEHRAVTARLIETTVELVRAEVALVAERARQVAIRSMTAVLATIVAAALLQVALVVGVLSPLLLRSVPAPTLGLAIALPAGLAVASLIVAFVSWRGVKTSLRSTVATARDNSHQSIPQLVRDHTSTRSQQGLKPIQAP